MDLDGEEEKMLRAIVQSAVVAAAAGRPFAGEFRHFVVRATRLQVNEQGVAAVAVTIWHRRRCPGAGTLRGLALPTRVTGRCLTLLTASRLIGHR